MDPQTLKTGDILIFAKHLTWSPMSWFSKAIEIATRSPYCHVGMILKDPTWIDPKLKGIYLWESSYEGIPDPQDGKVKVGVELTPIDKILSDKHEAIYARKLICPKNKLNKSVLENIHKIVYEKPYDFNPFDWLAAYLRKPIDGNRKNNRYFCSAFVACIFANANIIDSNTDWSLIRPSDFDVGDKHLKWSEHCKLEGLYKIK